MLKFTKFLNFIPRLFQVLSIQTSFAQNQEWKSKLEVSMKSIIVSAVMDKTDVNEGKSLIFIYQRNYSCKPKYKFGRDAVLDEFVKKTCMLHSIKGF